VAVRFAIAWLSRAERFQAVSPKTLCDRPEIVDSYAAFAFAFHHALFVLAEIQPFGQFAEILLSLCELLLDFGDPVSGHESLGLKSFYVVHRFPPSRKATRKASTP